MKPKRNIWSADTAIVLLSVLCLALLACVGVLRPVWLIPLGIFVLFVLVILVVGTRKTRRAVRRVLGGREADSSALATTSLPAVVLDRSKLIVWQNRAFGIEFTGGIDSGLRPISKIAPGLDLEKISAPGGQSLEAGGRCYTVYGSVSDQDEQLFFLLFVENSQLKQHAAEYFATRPAVMYILIDTYDEVLKEMRESERAGIISKVDRILEQYIGSRKGMLRRVSNSRYLAVVEERYLKEMVEGRFSVLDQVHKADDYDSSTVSLSIGVGRNGATFKDCEEMALQALDMALGRGGDQAAVKEPDGTFQFYGGVSRSVEKRTKVKSRIVAAAIKELVNESAQVLIMGHKASDMDSLGAALGMLRFCRNCKKPAAIVVNQQESVAQTLLERMEQEGYGESLLTPEQALSVAGRKTLLIVVDTHISYMLESPEVYAACNNVVVIDHHRKMVGHIDNAVVFYHEPYASSASELVSELLQYVCDAKENKPAPIESEGLLAGIMLDTRTFSLHVGVRTFEAAAYLRRMGAQTGNVKKLFATSMDSYRYRNMLVDQAHIVDGCAIVVNDQVPPHYEVVAPQAANDLLTIEGVLASFVAIKDHDQVRISARSLGEINVQLIMEKLAGGGHLTMAGAQLRGVSCEEAEDMILAAISAYNMEHSHPIS